MQHILLHILYSVVFHRQHWYCC